MSPGNPYTPTTHHSPETARHHGSAFASTQWSVVLSAATSGKNAPHLSLDWKNAETRYELDPAETSSPDSIYDREWALALLDQVLCRLREESIRAGKADQFDQLKTYLTISRAEIPYEQAARDLNMTEGNVRVSVHRLRKRYRAVLRDEVGRTLASHEQLEDEMNALFAALSR